MAARGVADAPVNQGKLCIKGIFEHELFNSANRGSKPLLREKPIDPYREVSWEAALDQTAAEIQRIQEKYGRDSVAIVSTGQILTEEFYTLGKLTRGVIGTNNYDGNTTLCMASAVSGYKRSFGSDGPPGCYDDFDHTECLLAFGSNLPEQHPIIYWRLKMALEKRPFPVIVVDPRVTMFAQMADIHLPVTPGTDLALLNALAHVILKENLHDRDYIAAHTTGFEEFSQLVAHYDPTTAAGICGIDEDTIRHVARLYAKAGAAMSIWTMGITRHAALTAWLDQQQISSPEHRQARRHQLVHHRAVQRHGRSGRRVRAARLPRAGEGKGPQGHRGVLGHRPEFFPRRGAS